MYVLGVELRSSGMVAGAVLLTTKLSHRTSPTVCVMINGITESCQIIFKSWYPPDIERMTLLLNVPHVLVIGHREIELELS